LILTEIFLNFKNRIAYKIKNAIKVPMTILVHLEEAGASMPTFFGPKKYYFLIWSNMVEEVL
jgi:hypothetical protein